MSEVLNQKQEIEELEHKIKVAKLQKKLNTLEYDMRRNRAIESAIMGNQNAHIPFVTYLR